jgi:uncharacterized membrane protein
MKVKWLIVALAVLVVMNIAALGAFLFTQRGGPREPAWHAGRPRAVARWVARHAPEERRELFRAMRTFHEGVRPLVEQTDALEADLIESMGEDPVPRAHIDSLLEQISRNRLEIARRATNHMISLGDSLSPEEREHLMDALVRLHRGPGAAGFRGPDRPPLTDRPFRRRR